MKPQRLRLARRRWPEGKKVPSTACRIMRNCSCYKYYQHIYELNKTKTKEHIKGINKIKEIRGGKNSMLVGLGLSFVIITLPPLL